ncbi:MAG: hypothetical protein H0V17_22190 [Deltaproteobacteria bacterium]|nr:hypothetical protein [Deltaproteobacteria bacterium]
MKLVIFLVLLLGCVGQTPYQRVTNEWTRQTRLDGSYQQVLQLAAVYKSEAWRLAHAEKEANARGLAGAARDQHLAQARADAAGPIEIEMLVSTWDRRENDLDRGKKSIWRVRMLEGGAEVEPIEILKDKRPILTLRSEFPAMGDFATAYVVRFKRPPSAGEIRVRMSSERGGVEVAWPVGSR